jgi:hypothetical protein
MGNEAGWKEEAREKVLKMFYRWQGWGYRPSGSPGVEPTVLASLALLAANQGKTCTEILSAADWLATQQQPHGSISLSEDNKDATWPTAYAILLWAALDSHKAAQQKAVQWLLALPSQTFEHSPQDPNRNDTTLIGWPWTVGCYAWIEPTAWAILALRRKGLTEHKRVIQGIQLIVDRALPSGGWNYGNSIVFDTELLPQPAPTGLALLAFSGLKPKDSMVEKSLRILRDMLPKIRSPQSLCWGSLGVQVWDGKAPERDRWFAEAYEHLQENSQNLVIDLAYLLFGASACALPLLGVAETKPENKRI